MTLEQLEELFNTSELPHSIQLSPGNYIPNVPTWVEKQLAYARHNQNIPLLFDPVYERLMRMKELIGK